MTEKDRQDNQTLLDFWDKAFALSEEDKAEAASWDPESWKELAPVEKLFRAAASLGQKKKVLDYGCGNGWAAIIAAKSGCPNVTAADAAPGAVRAAQFTASLCGLADQIKIHAVSPDWLKNIPAETYDGFICSNVLDVIPPETAEEILREAARIVTDDASVIIGLNYWLSPDTAAARGLELQDGSRLYVDGVLRLVSRTDEEWIKIFSPFFIVERLEYFAWPGEETETRRLFRLKKYSKDDTEGGIR
ncbi:MAG: methyltransferase domain-containing protein [Lachnospiraceae bacterium]|nr:methyltransferase domain-containing protein [Lachnospiraceae bacterium]